jgi:nucleotide-binding universal stress UspA family protein
MIVGVDGSENAWRALDWAGAEAERRADTVVVAHAGDLNPDCSAAGDFAHELLADAIARLADGHPGVLDRTEYSTNDAAAMLVALSRIADLVVIGQSGVGRIARLFVGSTAQHVLAHAHAPVVVIGEQIPTDGEVVVGVSMTEGGLAAMRFACAEARNRNVVVRAVRSWAEENWALVSTGAALTTFAEWEEGERELVAKWISIAQAEFPEIQIKTELTSNPVYWELEKFATSAAALLVLGCRRSDDAAIARLGPIATWAIRVARCPVAIVGHASIRPSTGAAREAASVSGANGATVG